MTNTVILTVVILTVLGLLLARFGRGMGYGPIRTLSGVGMFSKYLT